MKKRLNGFISKYFTKRQDRLIWIIILVLLITALLDICFITSALKGAGAVLSLSVAAFGALTVFDGKFSRFIKKAVVAAAVLEVAVFNFNSFRLIGGQYEEFSPKIISSTNFDGEKNKTDGESVIELDVGARVGTLTVDVSSDKQPLVTVSVDAKDDSNSAEYRYGTAQLKVIRGNRRSNTAVLNLSGDTHTLRVRFTAAKDESITLSEIAVNRPIDFYFSPIRYFGLILLCAAVYALTRSELLKREHSDRKSAVRAVSYVMTAVFLVLSFTIVNVSKYRQGDYIEEFTAESGNQITQELVDAFEQGRLDLDIDMNERLEALDNPYDYSQRRTGNIGYYPWDRLYYNGKYYSYYGIAPLLLFLPYHLITGWYFPSTWAVWLFGGIGILFLTKLYLAFADRFLKKIRSSIVILGLFIIQLSSGIWFCFPTPQFYEIAQSSGFACVAAGAYFLLTSNMIGEGRVINYRAALSSVFLALAVLCRPTLAVYCAAALIFIAAGAVKKLRLADGKSAVKVLTPYLLCALLPFVVIGGVQMLYNYARFGSVFDFGIDYSLTINDFTTAEFHMPFALIGAFNYIFALPSFTPDFPFFNFGAVQTFYPQGYYFIATASACGLLWKALPVFSYFGAAKAYRHSDSKNKRLYAVLIAVVCIICPLIIMFSIWESGYGVRYCVDFNWQILIGAFAVLAVIYRKSAENTKEYINTFLVIAAAVCLILNFGQCYQYAYPNIAADWQPTALSFGRLFEFWR